METINVNSLQYTKIGFRFLEFFLYGKKIQFVGFEFFPTLTSAMDEFDFKHNMIGITFGSNLVIPEKFVNPQQEWILVDRTEGTALRREIQHNCVKYPARHFERMLSFRERGYDLSENEFRKYYELIGVPEETAKSMMLYRSYKPQPQSFLLPPL